MKKHDPDVKQMSVGQLHREIMKWRSAIRKHRDAEGNARCWHNDVALYALLPEGRPAGKMDLPEKVLLRNCRRYIRRQQCSEKGCRKNPKSCAT